MNSVTVTSVLTYVCGSNKKLYNTRACFTIIQKQKRKVMCQITPQKIDLHYVLTYCKRKAVPLQGWSDPEGSRKLRLPDFMTTAQDGGKVVSPMHRPPLPQEMLLVLISVSG